MFAVHLAFVIAFATSRPRSLRPQDSVANHDGRHGRRHHGPLLPVRRADPTQRAQHVRLLSPNPLRHRRGHLEAGAAAHVPRVQPVRAARRQLGGGRAGVEGAARAAAAQAARPRGGAPRRRVVHLDRAALAPAQAEGHDPEGGGERRGAAAAVHRRVHPLEQAVHRLPAPRGEGHVGGGAADAPESAAQAHLPVDRAADPQAPRARRHDERRRDARRPRLLLRPARPRREARLVPPVRRPRALQALEAADLDGHPHRQGAPQVHLRGRGAPDLPRRPRVPAARHRQLALAAPAPRALPQGLERPPFDGPVLAAGLRAAGTRARNSARNSAHLAAQFAAQF